jgi:predicted lipoprotein with Yx(FWY)xxD motif
MLARITLVLAGATLAALALAGCSAPTVAETPAPESTEITETPSASATPTPDPDLIVGSTSLGDIVVDAAGRTVYYYDADTAGSGVSACSGECLGAWPPVHASSADPQVDGITGQVGVITGNDGLPQLTLNGMPLYYYVTDAAPGDVTGQGSHAVWWVVAPDGSKITG